VKSIPLAVEIYYSLEYYLWLCRCKQCSLTCALTCFISYITYSKLEFTSQVNASVKDTDYQKDDEVIFKAEL